MADYNGVDVTNGSSTGGRPEVPISGQRRRKHRDRCLNCYELESPRDYGMPLCDECATVLADRVDAIQGKQRVRLAEIRENDTIQGLRQQVKLLREALATKRERGTSGNSTAPRDGFVYYVEFSGVIKVGWASNLRGRLKDYLPVGHLLAVEPGTRKDEARVHKSLSAHRSHGNEWYAPTPSVRHHIEMVIAKHGQPPDLQVGANPVAIPQPRTKQYTQTRARSGGRVRHRA
jgi:hypothetical protein